MVFVTLTESKVSLQTHETLIQSFSEAVLLGNVMGVAKEFKIVPSQMIEKMPYY